MGRSVHVVAAALLVGAGSLLGRGLAGASATTYPTCRAVALSLGPGGNGITGGGYMYWVSVTNLGRSPCVVEGRPWVRVPGSRFTVTVDALRSGAYGGGPGRVLIVKPGESVYAAVETFRPCGGVKGDLGQLTVRVGWAAKSIAVTGEACLREGAVVAVGPFERK
jgi:hypothetical protein